MAITAGLPGLQVTVNVNGEALTEYDYVVENASQDAAQQSAAKYIEAPAGAEFEICTLYKPPYTPMSFVYPGIIMDGNYVHAPYEKWGGKEDCEGYVYHKARSFDEGMLVTRNFRFSTLQIGKLSTRSSNPCSRLTITEDSSPVTADQRRDVSCLGQINIYLYYVEGLEETIPENIPQAVSEEARVVNQMAMKQAIARGDTISCQTG